MSYRSSRTVLASSRSTRNRRSRSRANIETLECPAQRKFIISFSVCPQPVVGTHNSGKPAKGPDHARIELEPRRIRGLKVLHCHGVVFAGWSLQGHGAYDHTQHCSAPVVLAVLQCHARPEGGMNG